MSGILEVEKLYSPDNHRREKGNQESGECHCEDKGGGSSDGTEAQAQRKGRLHPLHGRLWKTESIPGYKEPFLDVSYKVHKFVCSHALSDRPQYAIIKFWQL
jgi:hypothetical protein